MTLVMSKSCQVCELWLTHPLPKWAITTGVCSGLHKFECVYLERMVVQQEADIIRRMHERRNAQNSYLWNKNSPWYVCTYMSPNRKPQSCVIECPFLHWHVLKVKALQGDEMEGCQQKEGSVLVVWQHSKFYRERCMSIIDQAKVLA